MTTDRQSELLWEQAIDDAATTGDYTAADAYALRARLEAERVDAVGETREGGPFLTPAEEAEKEHSILLHDGLLRFMLDTKADTTYIIVANRQFKLHQELIGVHDPVVRKKVQDEFDSFARDNQDQIDRTNAIRREYAKKLASE